MADVTAWPADTRTRLASAADPLGGLLDPSLDPIFWAVDGLDVASAWWPHVPFGHWIVSAARPGVLVDLGAADGVAFRAFCRAVMRGSLDTRCYSNGKCAGPAADFAFSNFFRDGNDKALSHFADRSVDLLHIDGARAYEALQHDFEDWRPKLSERAVVLLHNTNVRSGGSGVWRWWSEVCQQFPHFEFLHGNGLGLLAVGTAVPPAIISLCGLTDGSLDVVVRSRFAALGERWQSEVTLVASAADIVRARADTRAWERRATEAERAREQIVLRIDAARRDVYAANLHAEEAAALASARIERAEAAAAGHTERLEAALAFVRAELEQVVRDRDAILSSTVWRGTAPLRAVARLLVPGLRRLIGAGDGRGR